MINLKETFAAAVGITIAVALAYKTGALTFDRAFDIAGAMIGGYGMKQLIDQFYGIETVVQRNDNGELDTMIEKPAKKDSDLAP